MRDADTQVHRYVGGQVDRYSRSHNVLSKLH